MHVDIAIGSVLGASEYVAEAIQQHLESKGHTVTCHFKPDINDINEDSLLLICTSTHGAGDLPENIEPFVKQLSEANLSHRKGLIIGLGDSSYDTYCGAAIKIEQTIVKAGLQLLAAPLHIDVLHHPIPEDNALEWISKQELG